MGICGVTILSDLTQMPQAGFNFKGLRGFNIKIGIPYQFSILKVTDKFH